MTTPSVPERAATPAVESVATPPAATPPPVLDIGAMLDDATQLDTPVKLSDLKPWLERHTGELVERVSTDLRQRQQQAEAQRNQREEQQATMQADVEFARGIERRIAEGTEDERAAANVEMTGNRQRYLRGLAVAYEAESSQTRSRAVEQHVGPLLAQIKQDGQFQPYLDDLANAEKVATEHGGNWVLMALRYGDRIGYERGKSEAEATADQTRRIDEGASGPPALQGAPGGQSGDDLWAGIDRNKPGAAAQFNQRLAERRASRTVKG